MKKVLFIIFIYNFGYCFSQSNVVYYSKIKENVDCYLYFYKNGHYFIQISDKQSLDNIVEIIVSAGNYDMKKNTIFLYDTHGFKMIFEKNQSSIISKRTYYFLNNTPLKMFNISCNEPDYIKDYINNKLNESKIKYNYQIEKSEIFGIYTCNIGFLMNIRNNNTYIFEYNNIVLSQGNWVRDNNILTFSDILMNYTFSVKIEDMKLIGKFMIGDYEDNDIVLKKMK